MFVALHSCAGCIICYQAEECVSISFIVGTLIDTMLVASCMMMYGVSTRSGELWSTAFASAVCTSALSSFPLCGHLPCLRCGLPFAYIANYFWCSRVPVPYFYAYMRVLCSCRRFFPFGTSLNDSVRRVVLACSGRWFQVIFSFSSQFSLVSNIPERPLVS